MNYLAHLLLAAPTVEARLGALLGDFVKPRDAAAFGEVIACEIRLHRLVDSYTDAHPVVLEAKARFRPHTRRYAGILLDVYYDHALSTHWSAFCAQPREQFIADFHAGVGAYMAILPAPVAAIVPRMVAQDWLGSYAQFEGVEVAARRVSTRLSKGGEAMREGVHDLRAHRDEFERGFLAFFPQLVARVEAARAAGVCDAVSPHLPDEG